MKICFQSSAIYQNNTFNKTHSNKTRNQSSHKCYGNPNFKSGNKYLRGIAGFGVATFATLLSLIGINLHNNSYKTLSQSGVINYVEPLQTDFETRDEAILYAKNRVIEALNAPKPYEHLVLIDNATNEILAEFKGDENQVVECLSAWDEICVAFNGKGYTSIHGHPENKNGSTNPIGFTDFLSLINTPKNTVIAAVSRDGNISALTKLPYYSQPEDKKIENIKNGIVEILAKSFQRTQPQMYDSLYNAFFSTTDSLKKAKISSTFDSILNLQDTTYECHRLLHKFWEKQAPKLGLKYYTNFKRNNYRK